MDSVSSPDPGGPVTDALNDSAIVINFNKIANAHGPFRHQYPAADQIINDILSAKADTDRNTTTDEGLAAIDTLDIWYQENYPDFYAENQDLMQIHTVGELKSYIMGKLN